MPAAAVPDPSPSPRWWKFSSRSYSSDDGPYYVKESFALNERDGGFDIALCGLPGEHPELLGAAVVSGDDDEPAYITLPGNLSRIEWGEGTAALLRLVSSAILRDMPGVQRTVAEWSPIAAAAAATDSGETVLLILAARVQEGSAEFRLRAVPPAEALDALDAGGIGTAAEWQTAGQVTMLPRQMRDKDAHWISMFLAEIRDDNLVGYARYDLGSQGIHRWPHAIDTGDDAEFRCTEFEDEIGREHWVDVRQRHIVRRTGDRATIMAVEEMRPNRTDGPFGKGRQDVVAQLEIGSDTAQLLRAAANPPKSAWTPSYTLPSREWQRLPDADDASPLRYRFDGEVLRFSLASDPVDPARAALIVPHSRWLGNVGSWGGALADWFDTNG